MPRNTSMRKIACTRRKRRRWVDRAHVLLDLTAPPAGGMDAPVGRRGHAGTSLRRVRSRGGKAAVQQVIGAPSLTESFGRVLLKAPTHARSRIVFLGDDTEAIPLGLEDPPFVVEGFVGEHPNNQHASRVPGPTQFRAPTCTPRFFCWPVRKQARGSWAATSLIGRRDRRVTARRSAIVFGYARDLYP
jgi:hypothetical protein